MHSETNNMKQWQDNTESYTVLCTRWKGPERWGGCVVSVVFIFMGFSLFARVKHFVVLVLLFLK